jgi:hypothetical protein
VLGTFIQPDTIVPEPGNPQSLNRYAYGLGNPVKYRDPSGHSPEQAPTPPLPQLTQQAIDYFTKLGWQVVGDPAQINPSWNGADLVFTAENGSRVLAVELKDVAGNVDLGTLGKSGRGDYGGSISRVANSAWRFATSSKDQLRLMSQTVKAASDAGTLENALFTSGEGVSQGAAGQFGGVYRQMQGGVAVDKALAAVRQPGLGAQLGAAASAAWATAQSTAAQIGTALSTGPPLVPMPLIVVPRSILEQYLSVDGTIQG